MIEEMTGRSPVNDTGQGSKTKYSLHRQFQIFNIEKMLAKKD